LSYLIVFILSILLTYLIRRYSIHNNVMDHPNERSSHNIPTPRGGGGSVVITFLITLLIFIYTNKIDSDKGIALFLSGLLVALIGFIDDHGHINAKWRLIVHLVSATGLVYVLGGLPKLEFFGLYVDFGNIGYGLAVIAIIWILNLFNFMDGIDGIAGVEAITSTFFAGLFLSYFSTDLAIVNLHWYLTASVCGFLVLNFPPAKIFMGDAGSGFIGFILASFILVSAHVEQSMLWVWLVLLGVFIVDATFTLLHRLIRGEKVHEAHRSHAYQFASRKYNSHLKVTLTIAVVNITWLAPIAYLITMKYIDGILGVAIAYIPLVILAVKYNAGAKEP
jgi:Fuc2NAc and GlcNAc transferase